MRTEAGIMKISCGGFRLTLLPLREGSRKFWVARILDKNKKLVKELIDSNRSFLKFKAFEWIRLYPQMFR